MSENLYTKVRDEIVIYLNDISKYYPIYKTPKERLKELILRKEYHKKFWALKDINLKVKKGETLGIIGENGAGKSTLLKIISRTLTPSSGEIYIKGCLAPILELGMGFHPEMTGRQNIYLSGTLLGLSSQEIEERIEEIIAFSELGEFIDQPVKTYSSGMYIRLAFSVATCIDPDILVLDEVLAVGDQTFQKKCIDKIINFRNQQKTIVFCSHSTYHILQLCENAVWIKDGKIKLVDKAKIVIREYENYCNKRYSISVQNSMSQKEKQDCVPEEQRKFIYVNEVKLFNFKYEKCNTFHTGDTLIIKISWHTLKPIYGHIGFAIQTIAEEFIFGTTTKSISRKSKPLHKFNKQLIRIPKISLLEGEYQVIGGLLDDTGLQILDFKPSESFWIIGKENYYGRYYMEHEWD